MTRYYLGRGGAGREAEAEVDRALSGRPGRAARQTLPGNGAEDAWKAQPPYNWAPLAAGKGSAPRSGRLTRDVVIAGPSSLDLHVRSSARDTDLQVTPGSAPGRAGDLRPKRVAARLAPQARPPALHRSRSVSRT